jgi:hypothetical protein
MVKGNFDFLLACDPDQSGDRFASVRYGADLLSSVWRPEDSADLRLGHPDCDSIKLIVSASRCPPDPEYRSNDHAEE